MNKFIRLSCILSLYVIAYVNTTAQTVPSPSAIKGRLTTGDALKTSEVIIQLLQAQHKKLVKIEYPNAKGEFVFDNIPAGRYVIVTQGMAFTKYESAPFDHSGGTDLGIITLSAASTNLKETSVTAVKPFVQQQYDKTVLNVASSVTAAGSTALEVLEKAPGITIDQNDNIAMRGRQGVLFMIDGKLVPMTGQDLANLLRGMAANQIERIELITNPSAKYDASGNAGIIDIRMKKGRANGTNGNASLSIGQGVYPKLNPSLNINHKTGKLNLFGSYNYLYRQDMNDLTIYRDFYNAQKEITGSNNYDNYFRYGFHNHNLRAGADYNINSRIVLGLVANGIFTRGNVASNSQAESLNGQQQRTGYFTTLGDNNPKRNNSSFNFNYKHTLDTTGTELTADLDYARFNSNELQNYHTDYYDADHAPNRPAYKLFGDLSGNLSIKSFKADYTQLIKPIGFKMEAGIKSSWVESDNDVQFFDRSNGTDVLDVGKSNRFIYKENINAAYLNGSRKWQKLSLQLGLRVENTNAKGNQVTNKENFDRNYTQFFPSGYVGYAFSDKHDLGLSLSRRINRPSYRQLNPFKVFLDPLTSSAGNPFLNPEITYSFELTYTLLQRYTAKAAYSRTTDNILMVLSPDTEPNSVLQTGRNLAVFNYYSMNFGIPVSVGKWLSSSNNLLVYYGEYKGNLVNTDLNVSRVTFNLNSNNTITLNPNTSLEIIGSYQSRAYYGFLDLQDYWSVNVGAQRQLWNKKASVKLSINDIFFTNRTDADTRLTGYGEHFIQYRDTRVATLTFTYKFGKMQGAAPRRRTGGAEDEKRRAG
ncbi:TonB-dependent receptor domain-containing protein [Chitinophaga barathri]|uniref:TonB-dependent receptor n=1 Tax=Chitinophaga barathri TaxID=1647451 RepID=A0A3N4MIT5_9BACT|nr:TonB-dependent receptor [Chitinophaga barathri]RPD41717.1 TonB-dependent receptor [Chitinophaga barathri]